MKFSRDVASWSNEQQLAVHEVFEFEMCMHVRKTTVEAVPLGLRRETVDRMRMTTEQVRTLEVTSGVALGAIARQHLSEHQARQLLGSTVSSMPTDNTARHEISLDTQRDAAETNKPKNEDRLAKK